MPCKLLSCNKGQHISQDLSFDTVMQKQHAYKVCPQDPKNNKCNFFPKINNKLQSIIWVMDLPQITNAPCRQPFSTEICFLIKPFPRIRHDIVLPLIKLHYTISNPIHHIVLNPFYHSEYRFIPSLLY